MISGEMSFYQESVEKKVLVTNIQRFSLHDGPGIRTTVFLKGCSLRCPWCANPENLSLMPECYIKDGRKGVYGCWMTCDELYLALMKDYIFYGQSASKDDVYMGMPGGVTFSGGEPLLQVAALNPLMERLRDSNVHLCVETALFVPKQSLRQALGVIDLFYVDVKILDAIQCRETLGGDLMRYQTNTEELFSSDKPVIFRVPVIGGYTDNEINRRAIVEWIGKYKPLRVELIKEHNLGAQKYCTLGMEPLNLSSVTDDSMMRYKDEIMIETGVETEICRV